VLAGAIDVAVSSRPLKPEETAQGFTAVEYCRTPFVFATNRSDISNLTLQEAVDIYSGKKARWADSSPIRLVLRPASDHDTTILAGFSPAMKDAVDQAQAREGMVVAMTDQDSADSIERLPGAIGTTTLALVTAEQRKLRLLSLNGVQPTVTTLADRSYPHMKALYLVTKNQTTPAVRQFIDHVRSADGRALLSQIGCWVP
jgi:phosphate transport system substrate-binding protein